MTTTPHDACQPTLTQLADQVEGNPVPLGRLAGIRLLRTALDAAEKEAVQAARETNASWAAVGSGLGISRQAANQRFGPTREADGQARTSEEVPSRARTPRLGWEIAIPGRRALLHIRPRRPDAG